MEAMEAMEVVLSERDERSFNWKLLIENHSENYDRGTALTVFPNLMLNVFPDAALAMWVEPLSINRTVVHRRMYARNGTDRDAVAASIAAHRLVHAQDIASCLRVQDSHDAGVDGDGVLGPVEERVFRLHERLRGLLAIP